MNLQVIVIVVIMFVGSITLLELGISTLTAPNAREGLVLQYLMCLDRWTAAGGAQDTALQTFFNVTVGSQTTQLAFVESSAPFSGYTGDLPEPYAIVNMWTAAVPISDVFTIGVTVEGVSASMTTTALAFSSSVATDESCTSSQPYYSNGQCPESGLQSYCLETIGGGGGNFIPTAGSGTCEDSTVCGTCEYTYYLSGRTEMVLWNPNLTTYELVSSLGWPAYPQGSKYPWNVTDQVYTVVAPPNINLTLRPLGEPWMVAQNLTQGTMNFGETASEQHTKGAMYTVVATFALLLNLGAFVGIQVMRRAAARRVAREEAHKAAAAAATSVANGKLNEVTVGDVDSAPVPAQKIFPMTSAIAAPRDVEPIRRPVSDDHTNPFLQLQRSEPVPLNKSMFTSNSLSPQTANAGLDPNRNVASYSQPSVSSCSRHAISARDSEGSSQSVHKGVHRGVPRKVTSNPLIDAKPAQSSHIVTMLQEGPPRSRVPQQPCKPPPPRRPPLVYDPDL